MYNRISPSKAYEIMQETKDVIIVDVRTEEEFATGYIEGSVNIPHTAILDGIEEYTSSLDDIILIYCRSGVRSCTAANILSDIGYTNVYDFGGVIDWRYGLIKV